MIKAQTESNKIECCCPKSKFMVVETKMSNVSKLGWLSEPSAKEHFKTLQKVVHVQNNWILKCVSPKRF